MTFQNTPDSDIKVRPERVRFLAEIPIGTFMAIEGDLQRLPDWDRFFIMKNPVGWPEGMYEVISRHLGETLRIAS
jgi:hypothetical protein